MDSAFYYGRHQYPHCAAHQYLLNTPKLKKFTYDEGDVNGQGLACGSKAYGIGAGLAGFAPNGQRMVSAHPLLMESNYIT